MRRVMLIAALVALPAAGAAQNRTAPNRPRAEQRLQGARGQATPQQRAQMRQRIEARFAQIVAERLSLDDAQQTRLRSVMAKGVERRRQLAQRGVALRREAAAALGDETDAAPAGARSADAILRDLSALRREELKLWEDEQNELASFLSADQRLRLLELRARFDQRVMEMRRQQ